MKYKKGIGLLEVLLCVTILSVGLVIIYQPMLNGLSVLRYADERIEANRFIDEKMWEVQDQAVQKNRVAEKDHGTFTFSSDRQFNYDLSAQPVTKDKKLYLTNFEVSWAPGGRLKKITRSAYVKLPREEETE